MNKLGFFAVLMMVFSASWSAQTFEGTVTSVYDGDTFTLNNQVKVRLWGADAAEKKQTCLANNQRVSCGLESGHYLSNFIKGKRLTCEKQGSSYGRPVGLCYIKGEKTSINEYMVASGWAIEWSRYSGGAFNSATDYAKNNNNGMWNYEFVMPWLWRRNH